MSKINNHFKLWAYITYNKYTLNEIFAGINSMFNKARNNKNIENISICVEKILMMFVD